MANNRLVDNAKIVFGAPAKDYSGAANTEKYVSLENYNHCTIILQCGAWAGGTAAVTVNQATDTAAASAKALGFGIQFTNRSNTSTDTLVETTVTSNTFNLNTANAVYVIELDAATLDVRNSFNSIAVEIGSPGVNADLYSVTYILSQPRYASQVSSMPSAL